MEKSQESESGSEYEPSEEESEELENEESENEESEESDKEVKDIKNKKCEEQEQENPENEDKNQKKQKQKKRKYGKSKVMSQRRNKMKQTIQYIQIQKKLKRERETKRRANNRKMELHVHSTIHHRLNNFYGSYCPPATKKQWCWKSIQEMKMILTMGSIISNLYPTHPASGSDVQSKIRHWAAHWVEISNPDDETMCSASKSVCHTLDTGVDVNLSSQKRNEEAEQLAFQALVLAQKMSS